MLGQQGSLSVVVHTASNLHNVETFGKQDPYVQFAVTLEDKHAFQKTFVAKDAGKEASWNQSFELPLRGEPDLYIEVMDEEKGADELIGFAAVPLNQVVQSPGGAMRGQFDIYTIKGENAGSLQLTLTSRGRSYISEEHLKRVKSLRNKGVAGDVGGALLGAALAAGAGYMGNKLYQDHKQKQQEEEERRQQDEQRRQEEEKQRQEYERNRNELDEERERFEREKREEEERRRREQQEAVHRHHAEGEHHHHHEEHQHHHGAREFDPVGTYAAGDRVEYHGREYLCLQSHTSNPTWDPSNAPSLWRTC
ncbi:C2 domain-containing protein [Syncephalastrum racemosum]|uniref:C2 domain-containing protein n=1 Tax=Syncephalastrum racemosum TaxID=13706 RepID=A0A1X2HQF8_SYNRA|nr:C2 domain-containing protein [Syncephalastrum racemosum]